MPDEEKDVADHLLDAARIGGREGMTKEQFINSAGVFWDSWHEVQKFMSQRDDKSK